MKGIVGLLLVMLAFIGGTAWLAQEWRLEATQYVTAQQKDGDILRQQLESEGVKARAEAEADFERSGVSESAQVESETEKLGRSLVAQAESDQVTIESVQITGTAENVLIPLQGTLKSQMEFLKKANDENLSPADRKVNATIYDLLRKARTSVNKEYELMLGAIGKAMSNERCPGSRPY
jgi:hypothetical protein